MHVHHLQNKQTNAHELLMFDLQNQPKIEGLYQVIYQRNWVIMVFNGDLLMLPPMLLHRLHWQRAGSDLWLL